MTNDSEVLTYFCVSIPKLDSNIPDELVFESNSCYTRDSFHDRRFSVSDMTNCACTSHQPVLFEVGGHIKDCDLIYAPIFIVAYQ